jgi:PTS system mannose-specific IID component
MTGSLSATLRLLFLQGAWNYERMIGVGMGFAAQPLLEDLKSADPLRHAEASVRSADFFNSHPYLAGIALGALVRCEYDRLPGGQIARLRVALTSALGALGDQVFWAGLVPASVGAALVGVALGAGLWWVGAIFLLYLAIRVGTGIWALRTGLRSGARVGDAITQSWLRSAALHGGLVAGLLIGMAVPAVTGWLLRPLGYDTVLLAFITLMLGLLAGWRFGPRITAVKFGLGAVGLALLLAWGWS